MPDGPTLLLKPFPVPDGTIVGRTGRLDIVIPVIPPVAAAERTLEEMAWAAVTGQMVVASWMVSVTKRVEICSGAVEASLAREAELAGQLVILGAQLRTVRMEVVRTVRVVNSSPEVPFTWAIAEADPAADRDRTFEAD